MLGLAACSGAGSHSTTNASTGSPQSWWPTDPDGVACVQHPSIDECLADRAHECYWGPNYAWPVVEAGALCEPEEGICKSHLSPAPTSACTVDPANDAACRAHDAWDACLADADHRCWWTPAIGAPCTPDGWCPPPPHCETAADCPPACSSSGPTIDVPIRADCGCLTPPGGVCIAPAADQPATGCVARPACDSADICSCLTGLGTCTPGQLDNVCICDAVPS